MHVFCPVLWGVKRLPARDGFYFFGMNLVLTTFGWIQPKDKICAVAGKMCFYLVIKHRFVRGAHPGQKNISKRAIIWKLNRLAIRNSLRSSNNIN